MCVCYGCRFFKRYNKVVLDVAAVSKERSRLEKENADLRQLLKTFLDGIRCGCLLGALQQMSRLCSAPPQGQVLACRSAYSPGNHATWVCSLTDTVCCGLLLCCSVNDTVMNSATNPLLVVNQRLQHTMAAQRKQHTAQAQSPQLMLSGVAAGSASAGLGSPKSGSRSARAPGGASSGCSAELTAVMVGTRASAASPVVGGLLMSPRSATAPAATAK